MTVPVSIHTTLGFLSHSVVLCCILYGAGCMQGWFYYRKYGSRDGWPIQTLVAAVLVCDTCQIGFLYAAVYEYTVTNQGNPSALGKLIPNLIIELLFSGLIAFLVQHFYCHRIYALSRSWLLAGFVSLTSLGSIVTLYYFTGVALAQYTQLAQLQLQNNVSIATNVLSLVADLSITVIMIVLLHKSKTGFRRSTDMLNKLIIFSFNTGIPTSLCAVLTLVLLEAAPGTFIYIFIYVSMGRFYTNCLLVTLNSRDYIRHGLDSSVCSDGNFPMSIPSSANATSRVEFAESGPTTQEGITIMIDKTPHRFVV